MHLFGLSFILFLFKLSQGPRFCTIKCRDCRVHHHCTTLLKKVRIQLQTRFGPYSWCVGVLRWGNFALSSSVNHFIKQKLTIVVIIIEEKIHHSEKHSPCLLKILGCIVIRCAIWYYLYKLRNVKNNHRGVLLLVKLQAKAYNFAKINSPQWVFFTFFKLYKKYQIAQSITY